MMIVFHHCLHTGEEQAREVTSMKRGRWTRVLGCLCLVCVGFFALGQDSSSTSTDAGKVWVRPSSEHPTQPLWGHADGLRVGLWPMTGPRGLLRVYAPYLGHAEDRMINYIAIEPVIQGSMTRSFSELEVSHLDDVDGLCFWSADSPNDAEPRDPTEPARGIIGYDGGVETLTVTIFIEPYRSGAKVVLSLTFRADRPHEVGISTYTAEDSEPLSACIVTATMGSYARLRTLHLREGTIVQAGKLWPGFEGSDFTSHACFTLDEMLMTANGQALFVATPDEADPEVAEYAPRTFIGWEYYGQVATQSWRSEDPHPLVRGCVNGRTEYWASRSPIPGGIAFENFELIEPFREGATFWFGVIPGRMGSAITELGSVAHGMAGSLGSR